MPPFKKINQILVFSLLQMFCEGQLLPFFKLALLTAALVDFCQNSVHFLPLKLGITVSFQSLYVLKQPRAEDDSVLDRNAIVQEAIQPNRCPKSPRGRVFDFPFEF